MHVTQKENKRKRACHESTHHLCELLRDFFISPGTERAEILKSQDLAEPGPWKLRTLSRFRKNARTNSHRAMRRSLVPVKPKKITNKCRTNWRQRKTWPHRKLIFSRGIKFLVFLFIRFTFAIIPWEIFALHFESKIEKNWF